MERFIEVVIASMPYLVTGLLTLAGTVLTLRYQDRKHESEEVESYSQALLNQGEYATLLLAPMASQIKGMEERLKKMEEENEELVARVDLLEVENAELRSINASLRARIRYLESVSSHDKKPKE